MLISQCTKKITRDLRQEMAPQAEQLLLWTKISTIAETVKAGCLEEALPRQIKDHIILILEVKETSWITHVQKGSWR